MLLSVIVPCYNEEENVPIFYEEMMKNSDFLEREGLDLEIIYIDDGSKDATAAEVKKLHEKDGRVHLVSFSRNFGKEAGIYAGFQKSKGDYVVMMDVDLQDPPSLLPEMFSYIKQGYDSVATRRVTRKGEPPIRSFFARMFYTVPLAISSVMGVVFCAAAFIAIIALIIKNLIYHDPVAGWPSLVCIILLVSGIQLFCVGILGQYLSKTYMEVKNRPIYLVKEEL